MSAVRDVASPSSERANEQAGEVRWWTTPLGLDGWAVIVAALYAAAFVVWILVAGGADHTSTVVSDVAFLPIGIGAAVMGWRAAAHRALDRRTRRAWRQLEIRKPVEQRVEDESHLHPGEVHPEAHVGAEGEGQVLLLGTMDVESLGIGKARLVAIRRAEGDGDL